MRKMGIDFGTKKIGLALTDESGSMAFPHSVIPNDSSLLLTMESLIVENQITEIVIGKSLTLGGEPNAVQAHIESFITDMTLRNQIPIHLILNKSPLPLPVLMKGQPYLLKLKRDKTVDIK